jgi:hypothetical protein
MLTALPLPPLTLLMLLARDVEVEISSNFEGGRTSLSLRGCTYLPCESVSEYFGERVGDAVGAGRYSCDKVVVLLAELVVEFADKAIAEVPVDVDVSVSIAVVLVLHGVVVVIVALPIAAFGGGASSCFSVPR